MRYALLTISLILIGWGIAYDHVPVYFPLLGIVALGIIIAFLKFKKPIAAATRPQSQVNQTINQQAAATPVQPPITKQTGKNSGWLGFVFGAMIVLSICTYYHFSTPEVKVAGSIKKPPFTLVLEPLPADNGMLYTKTIPLPSGTYRTDLEVCVFFGKNPKPKIVNTLWFSLKKDQKEVVIISAYDKITLTPQ